MTNAVQFITGIGRVVGGDLYEANDQDAAGNARVIKKGADAGKPYSVYEFAVAFPKNGTTHWAQLVAPLANGQQCAYGAIIYQAGQQGFPQGQWQQDNFAWKVTDGDSTKPNSKGRKPCDREGYPGHWVFWFSSSYAPRIVNKDGSQFIHDKDAIKPGYYVQVQGTVAPNGDTMKPGVYLNHNYVSLQGYGEEIRTGPDPRALGFGSGPVPQGMQTAPVGGMAGVATPAAPAPAPMPAPVATAPAFPQQVPVQPHPGFLQPPGVPPVATPPAPAPAPLPPPVMAPPPVAAPPAPQMTAKAGAYTYAQYRSSGWTDEQLRAQGFMV